MLDFKSVLLRLVEPARQIIADVVLEHLWADDISSVAVVRNGQERTGTTARIRDTFGTAEM